MEKGGSFTAHLLYGFFVYLWVGSTLFVPLSIFLAMKKETYIPILILILYYSFRCIYGNAREWKFIKDLYRNHACFYKRNEVIFEEINENRIKKETFNNGLRKWMTIIEKTAEELIPKKRYSLMFHPVDSKRLKYIEAQLKLKKKTNIKYSI